MRYEPPPHGFRTFLIVWFTQSLSVFGSALTLFATTIWLTQVRYAHPVQQQQLALAVTAVSIAHSLPILMAAPVAGAWADRHDRKKTMMAMDFINGCLSLILFLLIAGNRLELWMLLCIVTLSSFVSSFHVSSFDTSYAMIVSDELLPRANGMMQTIYDLSTVLSPAIAATIISLPTLARQGVLPAGMSVMLSRLSDGTALAIGIDAATYFLAALTLVFLTVPSPRRSDLRTEGASLIKSYWADITQGANFIWRRRPLVWLLLAFTVANFLGTPLFVFQPLLVKFNLATDWFRHGFTFYTALAFMNSFSSLGGVVGGLAVSAWGGLKRRRIYGVLVPMIAAAACEIIYGLSALFYLSVAMIFIIGIAITVMNTHTQSIWQSQTPRELQGRVFAVRRLVTRLTGPVGTALAGWVGGMFNPGLVLALMGTAFLVLSISNLFNRTLLRVEDGEFAKQVDTTRVRA